MSLWLWPGAAGCRTLRTGTRRQAVDAVHIAPRGPHTPDTPTTTASQTTRHPFTYLGCRVSLVVLPQLFLGTATNYLDRTALSFASLQMNADLQLSTEQYGLAAATFALGAFVPGPGLSQRPLPILHVTDSCCWVYCCCTQCTELAATQLPSRQQEPSRRRFHMLAW